MERVMSVDERIRRAEERYNKKLERNFTNDNNRNYSYVNKEDKKVKRKIKKKLCMMMFICMLIYIVFYAFTNRDYIFSENFKKDVNSFFTEKTKIYAIYTDAKSYFENKFVKEKDEQLQENKEKPSEEEKKVENSENVGGAEENNELKEESLDKENKNKEKTQMEKDVDEIKTKLSFINPVEGRISSTFGWRNPSVSTVPKNHTGLDIAAVTGTVIKSATDGTISVKSSKGDYGMHYYITYDNITIIYAHCSKLYFEEGDKVKQGQEIAEVGSTGNSTGPHLHIGIKIDDRYVDPQLILDI